MPPFKGRETSIHLDKFLDDGLFTPFVNRLRFVAVQMLTPMVRRVLAQAIRTVNDKYTKS